MLHHTSRTYARLPLSNGLAFDISVAPGRKLMQCTLRLVPTTSSAYSAFAVSPQQFTIKRWISAGGASSYGSAPGYYQQQQGQPQQPQYGQAYYGYAPPGYPQQQVPQGGYIQPPYAPPPPPPQMMNNSGDMGMLGTKEKPLVVVSPPMPRTLASRLWTFLILIIGVSALMQLIDALEVRTGGTPSAAGGGVPGGAGGRLSSLFGVQEVKPQNLDHVTTTFSDIQGVDEAKEELEDVVDFLKDPKRFQEMGARLPKGCLLVGPPGTGKTMLARAIAKEAGVSFFYATGSEFDEMFVGVGSRRIRELFAAAKAQAPALIFIDEIDALGGKRSSKDHSHNRMTLNQLLAEMDGFQSNDAVVVIAATNHQSSLDPALTRPGRFDTTVAVDPPDLKGREAILKTYLEKIKRDTSFTALDIAKGTSGMTGADLANLINVAAIRAVVMEKKEVSSAEIDFAKDRVLMGSENRSKIVPEEEKKITAWHEGGHALLALLLAEQGAEPVHKATIVPRGSGIMGLVQQQPEKDRYSASKRQMISRLKVALGGRIAEEIYLGTEDVTSGASSDFQQATRIARAMVRQYGFSSGESHLGTIDYETAESSEGAWLSDATKVKIEDEVRSIVNTSFDEAKSMLVKNKDKLEAIATNLLAHETLSGEQLKAIVAGQPMPPSKLSTEVRKKRHHDVTASNTVTVTKKSSSSSSSNSAEPEK